ncbi:hypothetical protein NOMA109596_10925 [Nocardioides marinus]|uniref:PQQ-like domain-containing protein n=1 Tax=Nocardioides marinus TaxID=374514 RepID=A0A7Y9YGI9_9ACTN|nr:hypothetical protein [Nocardioides marinus]NYI11820.1 hypothetical protein [Nocardioides marinus]
MRWTRAVAWVAVAALWLACGPVVLLAAVAAMVHPRTRGRLRVDRPDRRTTLVGVAGLVLLLGAVWFVPDGRLPVPPGGGAWVTPGYTGRPVSPQPLPGEPDRPGPLGLSVEVDSGWYGAEHCGHLLPDTHERLLALCTSRSGARLKVLDPRTLRPVATASLPDPCADVPPATGTGEEVVVATGDRRLLHVTTTDGADAPAVVTQRAVDLGRALPAGACVVSVAVDPVGRTWFVTRAGEVGVVAAEGEPSVLALGESVSQPLAVDRDGAYVTTAEAVHRVVTRAGAPLETWRSAYETGSGRKPGQRDAGSGSGVTLLEGGLLALTDNANPRMHVVVLRAVDGSQVCRQEVFEDDASATEAALTAVGGTGVVVTNGHGWTGAWRGVLGRRPPGGVARVDVVDGSCATTWTSEEVAPTSGTTLSRATGLLYAWTKRRSWLGVDAWYLTALDARTGRTAFAARGGTGPWAGDAGSSVTIGPGGTAFVGTRAGLVRVVDGTRGLRD